jgi:uncharacterized protein YkwD
MVCLHRYARARQGLPALRVAPKLKASSAHKARDIERCQQFSHEACGRGPFFWFKRVGFLRHSSDAAENLALGNGAAATARGAMSDWLNSDAHRAVLLAPGLDEIGISVVSGRFQGYRGVSIWVAHFGAPR